MCCHLSYSRRSIFTILGKVTRAYKRLNPVHFGSDPADIQINPKIRIRVNPDLNPESDVGFGGICALRMLLLLTYSGCTELYFQISYIIRKSFVNIG